MSQREAGGRAGRRFGKRRGRIAKARKCESEKGECRSREWHGRENGQNGIVATDERGLTRMGEAGERKLNRGNGGGDGRISRWERWRGFLR